MQDKIIELLERHNELTFEEIRNNLGLENNSLLSSEIEKIENDNKIFKKGKKYYLIDNKKYVCGTLQVKQSKNAFLRSEDKDTFVPSAHLNSATNNDIVVVEIYRPEFADNLREGSVVKICKRGITEIIAKMTHKKDRKFVYFEAVDPSKTTDLIKVAYSRCKNSVKGNICKLHITHKGGVLEGTVSKVLGHVNDPGLDILALVMDADIPYKFNDDVMDELADVSDEVNKSDLKGRLDLTNEDIITIDGIDAKDLDDAVTVKKLPNGNYKLGVHIADVSSYVKANTNIDKEAYKRGTSVYLVDRVIPMLPHKLSNGICSLNPRVLRLVLSCIMEFDKKGNLVDSKIAKSFIKTRHRMDYDTVNKILVEQDKDSIDKYSDIHKMLLEMLELSNILRNKRIDRGALEFEVKEAKIIVDEKGTPIDIKARERNKAEMLIEDFMLAANECVAQNLSNLEYPCLYRIHDKPNAVKLELVGNSLKNAGVSNFKSNDLMHPKTIQKILAQINNDEQLKSFNSLLLRSMAKAKYHENNYGHYGLAATYYCHFTSPIRRYPDLLVHRIIHKLLLEPTNFEKDFKNFNDTISEAAEQTSITERRAIDLERNVNDMKCAEYMQKYIGKTFDGIVSSITSFGMFITLDNTVEGLVHVNNMADYFDFYPNIPSLVGQMTKEVYNIGDKVIVRVTDANKDTRKIDFQIIKHEMRKGVKLENRKSKQKSRS